MKIHQLSINVVFTCHDNIGLKNTISFPPHYQGYLELLHILTHFSHSICRWKRKRVEQRFALRQNGLKLNYPQGNALKLFIS